ncbi:hypothetical protein MFLAVUS_004575 [Mucor flavus]|uniref:Uncharacterized protein n=1 Tax=Mucor flavus TaxID=439312 RepID=A0ABP9YWA7_9FUNG
MTGWRHHENKCYAFSNRKMAQNYIARVVLGRTKVGEDFELFRQQHQAELRPNNDVRRTIVAYGDANIRGNTPIPVKQVQRTIADKAIIIAVDEFHTSVIYCHCLRRLQKVVSPLNICNHRKKKHRTTLKCYDEENHILHRTSQSTVKRVNYPLTLCLPCPVNNENRLYWNRDVKAAANIRSILVEYIRQDFNLNSRPAQLFRAQQGQGLSFSSI